MRLGQCPTSLWGLILRCDLVTKDGLLLKHFLLRQLRSLVGLGDPLLPLRLVNLLLYAAQSLLNLSQLAFIHVNQIVHSHCQILLLPLPTRVTHLRSVDRFLLDQLQIFIRWLSLGLVRLRCLWLKLDDLYWDSRVLMVDSQVSLGDGVRWLKVDVTWRLIFL